ncbi:MAG: hypothetical protein KKA65_02710 [Nanoarchaeota archaeon]|nr:hypothetical protein [Nanoarchaeota archaeon]MBU4242483.1 hypothetical protein [Nanoarchaeota archaeon]MBU4351455.1 hypothetical protein [Nanoarchaeota archaeon]MBU4456389.1 hypothetical protein [Nanoarchaeota archaeon]MCG2720160.1 hypothetical protein [Nanoarchaeota archaeon]
MSWKKKLKKIGITLAVIAGLNQIALPLMITPVHNLLPKNNISLEEVKNHKYPLKKDMSRIEFLCMASSLVHKAKSQEETWRNSVCEDYARATAEMYQYLIKEAGREDLVDKVTYVGGEIITPEDKLMGHAWLEVEMENEEIKLFESTNYTFYPSNSGNMEWVNFSCNENTEHFNPRWKLNYIWERGTSSGFVYPTLESFIIPGGIIRLGYVIISNWEEYMGDFLD